VRDLDGDHQIQMGDQRGRVVTDVGPAFEATAERREARARTSETEGNLVTAHDA
jgi:hypothetical protein